MDEFRTLQKKGLAGCFVDPVVDPDRLSLHISQIEPGTRAHPPHIHAGVEAFYVLEGSGTLEIEDQPRVTLSANQVVIVEPGKLHGFVNTGSVPLRYMVILAK
jgi:mannose-6-phosphate isomerase-like protein (cupin superfamily)